MSGLVSAESGTGSGPLRCGSCEAPLVFVRTDDFEDSNFYCSNCGAPACLFCGCTDDASCDPLCFWLAPGICSTHEALVEHLLTRVLRV